MEQSDNARGNQADAAASSETNDARIIYSNTVMPQEHSESSENVPANQNSSMHILKEKNTELEEPTDGDQLSNKFDDDSASEDEEMNNEGAKSDHSIKSISSNWNSADSDNEAINVISLQPIAYPVPTPRTARQLARMGKKAKKELPADRDMNEGSRSRRRATSKGRSRSRPKTTNKSRSRSRRETNKGRSKSKKRTAIDNGNRRK